MSGETKARYNLLFTKKYSGLAVDTLPAAAVQGQAWAFIREGHYVSGVKYEVFDDGVSCPTVTLKKDMPTRWVMDLCAAIVDDIKIRNKSWSVSRPSIGQIKIVTDNEEHTIPHTSVLLFLGSQAQYNASVLNEPAQHINTYLPDTQRIARMVWTNEWMFEGKRGFGKLAHRIDLAAPNIGDTLKDVARLIDTANTGTGQNEYSREFTAALLELAAVKDAEQAMVTTKAASSKHNTNTIGAWQEMEDMRRHMRELSSRGSE